MIKQSFKERVRLELIRNARIYYDNFVLKEYVVYSKYFKYKNCYLVSAHKDNYLHLTGVKTALKPKEFFEKCYNETLTEDDFDLGDKSQKGSIRRKINILEQAITIFSSREKIMVEENFSKNRISCSFASADKSCTVGFTKTEVAKPQTILKGFQIKESVRVDFILSREKGQLAFNYIENNSLGLPLDEMLKMICGDIKK